MKTTILLTTALSALLGSAQAGALIPRSELQGFDVSNLQKNVDWAAAYKAGARFAYIKASEGVDFVDPDFAEHVKGATAAKFIRGPYHFALPDRSSGAAQAEYFLKHGGTWTKNGITLPGAVDLEDNPYNKKEPCYGLTAAKMVAWIDDFVTTYHAKEKIYPVIYTGPGFWDACTGDSTKFAKLSPLWLASWGSEPGKIPGGWKTWTFWQNADTYKFGGDSDKFNGAEAALQKLAKTG